MATPRPQHARPIQCVTSRLPSRTMLATWPATRPSRRTVRAVTVSSPRILAQWARNASRSSKSSAAKAAMRRATVPLESKNVGRLS